MFAILLFAASAFADPLSPVWPNVFTQTFNETWVTASNGNQTSNGIYYYDYTTSSSRVDRTNGRFDTFCSLDGNRLITDGPCSQIVIQASRYLYYPKNHYCCWCCDSTHGCGVLRPTWMDVNETYIGTQSHMGVQAYGWGVAGGREYWETAVPDPSQRVMVSIYEGTDLKDFKNDVKYTVPNGIFDLPIECDPRIRCPVNSICGQLAEGTAAE